MCVEGADSGVRPLYGGGSCVHAKHPLTALLDWLTHDGQAYAAANLCVPLPPQVRQLALTML